MPPTDPSDDRPLHTPDDLPIDAAADADAGDDYSSDYGDGGDLYDAALDDDDYTEYEYDLSSTGGSGSWTQEAAVDPRPAPPPLDILSAGLWWRLRWFIFVGAFVTPLLIFGGLLLALDSIDGDEDDPQLNGAMNGATIAATALPTPTFTPTPVPNAAWPENVVYIPHTSPARIRNMLDTTSTKHGYLFEGTAGELWQIAVSAYDGSSATPIVMMFGPSGTRICQETGCAGEPRSSIAITLNENGPYRLVIESTGGTGLYLFTLDTE